MARKKKEFPLITGVEITDLAAEGNALCRIDDMVMFVPFAAPGDRCTVQVVKKKRNFMQGRIVSIESPSPIRKGPFCTHFTVCGGCKWQHIPYEIQLRAKEQQVTDALVRLGKVEVEEMQPILGSEQTEYYRNKLEFTFSNKRWLLPEEVQEVDGDFSPEVRYGLGFHIPGMFDKVLDIRECHLGAKVSDEIRLFIREYCMQDPERYPFFDLRNQEGLMRTLMIRTTSTGELMVVVVFFRDDVAAREALLAAVAERFPQITSLLYVINTKCNDTIGDQEVLLYHGREYIEEEMEGLKFKIGAKSFYQTNSRQAYQLYRIAREFAGLTGDELVYDLYTGTGTIANFVAGQAHRVIGIEYVPEAIEDARTNSLLNGIENTLFYAGDMKDILTNDFIEQHGRPDVVITDPPRAGMHESVIDAILFAAPRRIVYVSCNPATQARDLALLMADGRYRAVKSRPVDMFPHTHHVENVVLLVRNTE
ncbi:23S rRNA (uracil(1939)-C(5))-methyltransferase RlmD [Porphyromonas gingivalis]|uniref:23S rRNA (uracil(1939)-C(5))-methyltransferase RlmD n=1 Tax=Porphyromonas gingivalis TaxID=837 RepID=UPI000C19D028|nr:23S rRNA (uracil(1939)-C(5))-methyltransferase RlmD [Porphyromonas gingivalis]ATS01248.1 23S rRNA (uracil(1939)-C(5))-methyltransferase RlmD [Porphyromonas gingivalis]